MKAKRNNGYSTQIANMYITDDTPIILLSEAAEPSYKWLDGRPTKEVVAKHVICGVPNDTMEVRFEKEPKLPQFGSRVNFEGLEACEVNNRVYFRAKSIRKVG